MATSKARRTSKPQPTFAAYWHPVILAPNATGLHVLAYGVIGRSELEFPAERRQLLFCRAHPGKHSSGRGSFEVIGEPAPADTTICWIESGR